MGDRPRNPEQERERLQAELQELAKERSERFPVVHEAVLVYADAQERFDAFMKSLTDSTGDRDYYADKAKRQVHDWSTNLIPGVRAARQLSDWMRISFGGSLRYGKAPYQPTRFEDVRSSVMAALRTEQAVREHHRSSEYEQLNAELETAAAQIEYALARFDEEQMSSFLDLQQKMFEIESALSSQ